MARFNKEQILTNLLPHIIVGIVNGSFLDEPVGAALLGVGFIFYEWMDKRENKDQAAPAILGWLIGLAIWLYAVKICKGFGVI